MQCVSNSINIKVKHVNLTFSVFIARVIIQSKGPITSNTRTQGASSDKGIKYKYIYFYGYTIHSKLKL